MTQADKCMQCGRCCIEVGRTFWKAGKMQQDLKPLGDIEELNALAMNGDHEDGGLPCEMLQVQDGKAVCLIHQLYGYDAKPITCKDYPEAGEVCFREQAKQLVNPQGF